MIAGVLNGFERSYASVAAFKEQRPDTVASQDNNVLDVLRAGYRDSDNPAAGDRDDLAAVAAR
jgi:hypothetical protein